MVLSAPLCRFEEYYDYIFPDEAANQPNLKILEAAYRWKRQKVVDEEEEEDEDDGDTADDDDE